MTEYFKITHKLMLISNNKHDVYIVTPCYTKQPWDVLYNVSMLFEYLQDITHVSFTTYRYMTVVKVELITTGASYGDLYLNYKQFDIKMYCVLI